jgi:4-amino-4-deoxy-L-arabinose transferase-like glycosyltransferase
MSAARGGPGALPPAGMSGLRGRWPQVRAAAVPWTWPLLLAGAVWLAFFHGLGSVPLFDVDEGAFGEATREMLARDDYVSTWLNGRPRFDKPILTYWLQALSVRLFGLDEFALRLPSALAATAWIGAIHAFVRRELDRDTARAAAFIAATSAGVVVIGRGAIADALLNLFLALAMFDVYRELVDPRPRWRRRAFLWIGLGVLTKGPVALLVPGAASAVAFLLCGRGAGWWRAVRDPAGWLILLVVAGPWYALEYARRGDAFLAGFFLHHNVERFLVPLQGHAGGPLYYAPALLLLVLPYTTLLLATLPGVRRLRATPLDTLLWSWFLFVYAFFTLAGTKLPHYLLYGATPLFVLMARARHAARNRLLALLPASLLAGAIAALPTVLRYAAPGVRDAYVREALSRTGVFDTGWRVQSLALVAGVLLLAAWPGRRRDGAGHARVMANVVPAVSGDRAGSRNAGTGTWPRLAAAALLGSWGLGGLLLPAAAELQQGPVKRAALLARQAGWPVRSWRIDAPSFSVYRTAVTPEADVPRAGDIILTRSGALAGLGPVRVLFREGGVVLVRVGG